MFENLKDFFLYCYQSTERMEEKSAKFAEMRQERIKEFREEHKEAAERARERMDQIKEDKTEKFKEMIKESGLATTDELDEVKQLLADLGKKVDSLLANKKPDTRRSKQTG